MLTLAAGCSQNDAATSACSAKTDSDSCSACCTSNGANGYKYATGSTCACLGGGGSAPPAPGGGSASTATSFAGTYKSTWGQTVIAQDGTKVTATYPRGTMTCQASGNTLDCDWREGANIGKARLTKQANGSIHGTWGNGASATDGGPWIFNP
jgi:hypothetical protein